MVPITSAAERPTESAASKVEATFPIIDEVP